MKLTVIILLSACLQVSARGYSQQISISERNAPLQKVFRQIQKQSGYDFLYSYEVLQQAGTVNVSVHKVSIEEALEACLKGKPLAYNIVARTIIIKPKAGELVPEPDSEFLPPLIDVHGRVVNEKGEALLGVSILEKGTGNGVSTDQEGRFQIRVNEGAKLVFSFVGMIDKEVLVRSTSPLTIVMENSKKEMDNVVVVVSGYFNRSKQTFTGAATSFSGEELRKMTNQNVLSALTIMDPAFKLMENNLAGSNPNAMPDFQVRGAVNIRSSMEEKYNGTPNVPTFILDGFEVSLEKIYDLDPLRIENITILKDAAALAIYGSRGANGVVVITTNSPAKGKLRTTYTGSFNLDAADLSDYHLLNAREKLEYEKIAGIYTPNSYVYIGERYQDYYNERLKLVQQGYNTTWVSKPVKKAGVNFKHALNLEGGDDAFRYSADLSYNPSTGVMKGSGRDRKGIGVRLNYNKKSLRFFNQMTFDNVQTTNSPYGSFSTYAYLNPYYYPFDEEGNVKKILYVLNSGQSAPVTIVNPMYNATINTKDQSRYDNFINNFSAEWLVNNDLRLNARFSINRKTQITDVFKSSDHTDFVGADKKGSYIKGTAETMAYEGTAGVNYNRRIVNHLFVLNANYNVQEIRNDMYSVTASGFPNDLMDHVGMGLEYFAGTRPQGFETTSRLMGLLGNMNYSFDNRFLADISIRYDGSSQFGSNKRWASFWSAGLGWNLHNEKFLKDAGNITLLRVRGSFGYTGNQNFYPYQSIMTYSYFADISYDGNIGAAAAAFGNPNLKWQRTQKRNLGLDFEFLRGKLSGYFNYYSDYSEDMLVDVTMPPSLGFDTYKANLGEVQNRGYELSLKTTVLSVPQRKFYWNIVVSGVHNDNKLKKISNALNAYNNKVDGEVSNKPNVRFIEGMSMNTIWVVRSLGIDPATGQEVFLDKSGKPTNVWSAANYVAYATTDSKAEGTVGTNFGWNGFQLNLYARYKFGGNTYNNTLVNRVENVNPNQNVDQRVFYERWKAPGDFAVFKAVSNRTITQPTSRFVEKDNVLEMKTINLSYTFNQEPWLRKVGIERLRITSYMNDVFRLSTVKAERGIDYPFARHYALTLQATF